MEKKPIEGVMNATMQSLRDMVDVNTVVGDPVVAGDGSTIIPVSRVSFGFVSGGGEYEGRENHALLPADRDPAYPFAGGAGAGVSLQPMGFLVVNEGHVRLLPAQHYAPLDRVIDLAPQVLTEIKNWASAMAEKKAGEA